MPTGLNAFNRDVITGARADVPTGVCAFSRDEATGAQVCVDSNQPADGKSDEWVLGEFDTAVTNTVKARMNGIKLSSLRYIDVDVDGQQCTGLVDSGAEICLTAAILHFPFLYLNSTWKSWRASAHRISLALRGTESVKYVSGLWSE